MLIQRRGGALLFVPQRTHAALAASLMSHWQLGGLADNPRREAILTATREHDEGWAEEDAELHVGDNGDPLDFVAVPPHVKHRIWPRAAERVAAATSPYVAALVAQHALTVHAPLRPQPSWRDFFARMERTRDAYLSRAAPEEAAAAANDYTFVRIGDQLSLIFCNGWTTPMSGTGFSAGLEGSTLRISPDPFGGRRIPMQVEARTLPARSYESSADLRQTYEKAPSLVLEGEAVGA
ncbi:MAG: DUF3891 family protein [Vicinamibacterales bacterium]